MAGETVGSSAKKDQKDRKSAISIKSWKMGM